MSWQRAMRMAHAIVRTNLEPGWHTAKVQNVEVTEDQVRVEYDNGDVEVNQVRPLSAQEKAEQGHWEGPAPECGLCGGTGLQGGRTYSQSACCFMGYAHNTCLALWNALWRRRPKPEEMPPPAASKAVAERKNRCERNGARSPYDNCGAQSRS